MKNSYEKPVAEQVSFEVEETIADTVGTSGITGGYDD